MSFSDVGTWETGGWKMTEGRGMGVGVKDAFVILHVTGLKRGMEIEQWKKC